MTKTLLLCCHLEIKEGGKHSREGSQGDEQTGKRMKRRGTDLVTTDKDMEDLMFLTHAKSITSKRVC